jgi:hypothetical protein
MRARGRDVDGADRHDQPRACFDAREGGSFRISLTYDAPTGTGKTTADTDTFRGRFVKLVTNEQVVEVVEFETTAPALRGEMTIMIALADADGGTDVLAVHDGLPRGLSTTDNEVVADVTRETRGARRGGLGDAPYVRSCDYKWRLSGKAKDSNGSPTAVQGIEKTSIQCPSLPDLGRQSFNGTRA